MRTILSIAAVLNCLGLTSMVRAEPVDEIKRLIPAAAAISLADFDHMATLPTAPKASDYKQQTLTLSIFALKAQEDDKAKQEFHWLIDRPKPKDLAKETMRLVRGAGRFRFATGPVTLIHADRITDITCTVEGDKASGVVSFHVPKLMEGKVHYTATRSDDKWVVDGFSLPVHGVEIALKDDVWVLQ